jgi:tetratricopeptide (TPR) repeat protein
MSVAGIAADAQRIPEGLRIDASPAAATRGGPLMVQILPAAGESGLPPKVVVEIDSMAGGITKAQPIQTDGTARFDDLNAGTYIVRVRAPGYQDQQQNAYVAPASRGATNLTLNLGSKTDAGDSTIGGNSKAVSVQALAVPPKAVKEFQKAINESSKQHYDQAVSHLHKALKIVPSYFEALVFLAEQLVRLNRWGEAGKVYESCAALQPSDGSVHYNFGVVLLRLKEYRKAEEHLGQAATLNPQDARTHFYLGQASFQMGNYESAIRCYLQVNRLEPQNLDAMLRLGDLFERTKQVEMAVVYYRKFLQMEEQGPRATYVRSRLGALR